jgi:hypothetical protein
MRHTDITDSDWDALIESIKQPDNHYDLNDLTRAVMAKFQIDEAIAKRLVRRRDQRMTLKPREADGLDKVFRLAMAAGCPGDVPAIPWLLEHGLVDEVEGGFLRFKVAKPGAVG